jgi:hypothetical protein
MSSSNPVVLLGAGASKEAGIPMSYAMTERVRQGLRESPPQFKGALRAFNFVCATLSAYDASRGRDPAAALDVERVFDAVGALAERHESELAAFVTGWHPAVDELNVREPLSVFDFHFRDALKLEDSEQMTHTELRELIRTLVAADAPGSGAVYASLQGEMVRQVKQVINKSQGDVEYLHPLVRAGRADGGMTIATLNYDTTVETAGDQVGVQVATGINHWHESRKWEWRERGVRLLKLHGSVDWMQDEKTPRGPGQVGTGTERHASPPGRDTALAQRAMIFGHASKLQPDGPVLSLLAEFEERLAQTDRLVVVGYSFRDPHVDAVIRRWFSEGTSRRLHIVDPYFPKKAPEEFRPSLRDDLLRAFDQDFWARQEREIPNPERLQVHRNCASVAIEELFGQRAA